MSRPNILDDPGLQAILAAISDARIVGGAVRDTLAGLPTHDIDLATQSEPDAVITALRKAGLKAIPTGLVHGTVTAVVTLPGGGHRGYEITTLRRDIATDGRHATIAFTDDWRADAARRDFTINAMSMDATGTIFDYFHGTEDLRAGLLRFVGEPTARIAEDYLRILRFFRFWARYGSETPDQPTIAALRTGIPGLAQLSVERIWTEFSRILATPGPMPTMNLMNELGILSAIIPEGTSPARLQTLIAANAPPDPLLRLAALLTGDALTFATRLRLSAAERDRLIALLAAPPPNDNDDDDTLRRHLADTPTETLIGRTWLNGAPTTGWAALRARLQAIHRPIFPLEGRDALAIGLPPGPSIGILLHEIRTWWLTNGCRADSETCRAELHRRAQI